MASPRGSWGSTTPMQPCRWPLTWRVTKTPRFSAKIPSVGICERISARDTASVTASRANFRSDRRSASERDGISGLCVSGILAGFEDAELSALLDAAVELGPEALEVLPGGNECADDD